MMSDCLIGEFNSRYSAADGCREQMLSEVILEKGNVLAISCMRAGAAVAKQEP